MTQFSFCFFLIRILAYLLLPFFYFLCLFQLAFLRIRIRPYNILGFPFSRIHPEPFKSFAFSIKIENKSSEKLSYNSYDWELQDSDGDIQSIDAGLQFTVDGALNSGDLAPNGKKSADLYFQVPKDDANLMLHYKASFWQDKTLNIKL
ncbi:DUF4352 domain-containing protein [Lachnospiraceae bacterium LCP19S3_B12]